MPLPPFVEVNGELTVSVAGTPIKLGKLHSMDSNHVSVLLRIVVRLVVELSKPQVNQGKVAVLAAWLAQIESELL